ncbi:unnamed protein product [Ixodes persulcatus]
MLKELCRELVEDYMLHRNIWFQNILWKVLVLFHALHLLQRVPSCLSTASRNVLNFKYSGMVEIKHSRAWQNKNAPTIFPSVGRFLFLKNSHRCILYDTTYMQYFLEL